jgi:hypothetical protein
MTHANCGCCCDNSYPLIGPTGPTGTFYVWLNATGLLDAGPLAPQEYRGQGFERYLPSPIANNTGPMQHIARAGTLEFPDFKGDVVVSRMATDSPVLGNQTRWLASNMNPVPVSGATLQVSWGQHTASIGGPSITGPSSSPFGLWVAKSLALDGTAVPLHGMGMPNGDGIARAPLLALYRTRLADDLDFMTVTDGEPATGSLAQTSISPSPSRDKTNTPRYYRTPAGMIVEFKSLTPTLEGRIVVERDGVVVADRIRPTGPVYDADTAADGSYIVSKYFGREYDDPNKIHLWPPRPERLVSSFAKDTTVPKYGFVAVSDRYSDENQSTVIVFATKPYNRVGTGQLPSHADESVPGAAVRPSPITGFGNIQFAVRYLPSEAAHTTVTLGGSPATGPGGSVSQYRDIFGVNPTSLPVVPCRVFPVPSAGKGPRPVLEHPGASIREPYRPLTQAERVTQVGLTFSEDILPTGVTASQVQLSVDGVAATGCTITPVLGGQRSYKIGVPVEPQVEGAFVVLTYDPASQVFSATGNRPAELAARTSWMMQTPYKQDRSVAVGARVVDIGQLASLSATGPIGPAAESLTISLTTAAHIDKRNFGTVSHRPTQDLFSPQMPYDATGPAPTTGPTDCSYYGMSTIIWPCSPTGMSCAMPRAPQPHNSAFRHGRGAGNITVTLTGTNLETANTSFFLGTKVADSLEQFGALVFAPTRNGLPMPQGTWAMSQSANNQVLLGTVPLRYDQNGNAAAVRRQYFESGTIEGTLTANRSVTEYPQLGLAFAWSLELNIELKGVVNYSYEHESLDGHPVPENFTRSTTFAKTGYSDNGIGYDNHTCQIAVTAAEELAGTLTRQPIEYGWDAIRLSAFIVRLVPTSSQFFAWPAPGERVIDWHLGTIQVDF